MLDDSLAAFMRLRTHSSSRRTWAICRSSTYAGPLDKDGHKTHYASRRTTFRSASFKT